MASNGLIANPKKTALIFLKLRNGKEGSVEVKIGDDKIMQQSKANLPGITFEESQKWNAHLNGKGGIISSLNQRLYLIKRLSNSLNKKSLIKVAESIFTSKIRYGLQLLGRIRWTDADPKCEDLMAIQKTQNKLTRFLNNSKISDKISTKTLLKNINGLSVNQLNAQIKLTELWKSQKNKIQYH